MNKRLRLRKRVRRKKNKEKELKRDMNTFLKDNKKQ